MSSLLNSTELKRIETRAADVVVRASHYLILDRYIKVPNLQHPPYPNAQKMKFSIEDFFSKYDQTRKKD